MVIPPIPHRTRMRIRLPALILVTAALAACDRPSANRPTADEYAVWSVAVDDLGTGENHAFVVASSTPLMHVNVAEEAVDLRTQPQPGIEPEMLEDYAARNRIPVVIDGRKLAVRRVSAYVQLAGLAGTVQSLVVPARAMVSRPGFSADGRHAIVMVGVSCGSSCESGHTLLLRRGADGMWRVERMLSFYKT
jgi:hypothetical protein